MSCGRSPSPGAITADGDASAAAALFRRANADFVVVEAVPQAQQDGPDQTFFWVYENEWPTAVARQPVPATRGGW